MTTTKPFQLGLVGNWEAVERACPLAGPEHFMEDCEAAMQALCPPFVTFGAHPGDGADFGFWPDWETLLDFFPEDQEYEVSSGHIVSMSNGGDDVTVMDLDRNILWSTV